VGIRLKEPAQPIVRYGELMAIIDIAPDYEYRPDESPVEAIKELQRAVVEAFKQHDKDLRAEVEKVNSQIRWLIGSVVVLIVLAGIRRSGSD
jgi:hypothetical protein